MTHLKAAKGVLKYLKGTVNHGLSLGDCLHTLPEYLDQDIDIFILFDYCDADFSTNKETRKSRTGYLFLLNGSQISWQSKLQPTVSTSTTEAKYQSASSAVKEALWLKNLISDLTGGRLNKQILT